MSYYSESSGVCNRYVSKFGIEYNGAVRIRFKIRNDFLGVRDMARKYLIIDIPDRLPFVVNRFVSFMRI